MKKQARFALRLLVGVFIVVAVFWLADIKPLEIVRTIEKVNLYIAVLLIVPLQVIHRLLMSYKWNLLLRAARVRISLWDVFKLYLESIFVSLALPNTIGADLFRVHQMSVRKHHPATVLASIVVERFFGLLAVTAYVTVALPFLVVYFPQLRDVAVSLTIIAAMITLVLALFMYSTTLTGLVKTKLAGLIGRQLTGALSRLYQAFTAYHSRQRILVVFFLLSITENAIVISITIILAELLGIDMPWHIYVLIVPITNILIRIPLTIGGIGAIEASYVYFFVSVGMSAAEALSLALLADAFSILFRLSGGFVFAARVLTKRPPKVRG